MAISAKQLNHRESTDRLKRNFSILKKRIRDPERVYCTPVRGRYVSDSLYSHPLQITCSAL